VAVIRAIALAALIGALAGRAEAQPGQLVQPGQLGMTTSEVLRDGNTAATAGDWQRVAQLVDPLLQRPLVPADLAEAHRLAGIAAFFQQRNADAESHFLAYLRIDLDGRLDPALYPPDVVAFFNDVTSRHAAELRARRPRPKRSWLLNLLPPGGQFQNGERTKAWVLGGLLGGLLAANVTSYLILRSWCTHTVGPGGVGATCDDTNNHNRSASILRPINIASGIGLMITYAFGVYDGVQGYRQHAREQAIQPFAATSTEGSVLGITGSF
jgi:hypothetical protein